MGSLSLERTSAGLPENGSMVLLLPPVKCETGALAILGFLFMSLKLNGEMAYCSFNYTVFSLLNYSCFRIVCQLDC